jgi:hypothetical protein
MKNASAVEADPSTSKSRSLNLGTLGDAWQMDLADGGCAIEKKHELTSQ